ncbi:MAG: ribosome maturation factor RimP [bacterium]
MGVVPLFVLMETRGNMLAIVEKEVGKVIEDMGYELVDIEYTKERGGWVLRLFVDRIDGNITLRDCENISQVVSLLLDEIDPIPYSYNLEVFSPGLDRPLKKIKDFVRFIGHKVQLKLKDPIEGARNIKGIIKEVDNTKVLIDREGTILVIPFENILKARLEIDL